MFEQDVVKPEYIVGYILSLLALSWVIQLPVALGLLTPLSLAILPFLPGILALIFWSLEGHPVEVHARPLLRPVSLPAALAGVAYPALLVGIASLVAVGTGLGYLDGDTLRKILTGGFLPALAFLSAIPGALGQEYGYRGYLLPALTHWEGRSSATLITGIIWGIAVAPTSFLALSSPVPGEALALTILSFLFTVTVSFAFSWCYSLSENILPVTLMNTLAVVAIPATFSIPWNLQGQSPGPLIPVTWPSSLPLLLLVSLAFVPVFLWIFTAMEGDVEGDAL